MKCLEKLTFKSWNIYPQQPGDYYPPLELDSLKHIVIEDIGYIRGSPLDFKLMSWLAKSRLPALEHVHVQTSPRRHRILPDVFRALLRANTSVTNISKLTIDVQLSQFPPNNFFGHLFLQTLPQITPNLKELSILIDPKCFLPQVAARLKQGDFHPSLESTLCVSLETIRLKEFHPYNDQRAGRVLYNADMLELLRRFKRLNRIPVVFRNTSKAVPLDWNIDYLLRINYGGGRLLIPEMSLELDGSSCAEERKKDRTSVDEVPRQKCQDIVPSLWPHILERASKDTRRWTRQIGNTRLRKTDRLTDGTAIYRMLRPNSSLLGPALEGVLHDSDPKKQLSRNGEETVEPQR